MASKAYVVGVDFGTSNTYLTLCPYGTKNKTQLHLRGTTPAVDTAILYADSAGPEDGEFPLIGDVATKTYGSASPEERERLGYRYHCNFKPEIVGSALARRCAVDFFEAVKVEAKRNGCLLDLPENELIVGAPCEASAEFRSTLRGVIVKAGLDPPEVVDEPKGVLLTDLGFNRFPLADIMDGYLVVDFGGGTCDFALLRRGEVVSGYGNMSLGGRLFDDLFYQWFLDKNQGVAGRLADERREFFVWSYLCRLLKEDFSETVARDPKCCYKAEVGKFGTVGDLTLEEFEERAGSYSPSASFRNYADLMGVVLPDKIAAGGLDLIAWFRDSLLEGVKPTDDIRAVSLSGGSSKWYFVRRICEEILRVKPGRILGAPNPFGAISEGLAILPAVKDELEAVRRRMTEDKGEFVEQVLIPRVKSSFEICAADLASAVTSELFDGKIVPHVKKAARTRFVIDEVEDGIGRITDDYKPRLVQLVDRNINSQTAGLGLILQGKIQVWLDAYGLRLDGRLPSGSDEVRRIQVDRPMEGFLSDPLVFLVNSLVASLTSLLVASICGGTGMALLASGPMGLILGAGAGAWLGYVAMRQGRGGITKAVKGVCLPGIIAGRLISDSSILKARNKLETSLREEIDKKCQEIVGEMSERLDKAIVREIDQVGIVNLNIPFHQNQNK
ncbi:MAG: hypothetical protein LBO05_00120 [Deltaproteobacteria bacterium]|jgi:hypothetical protein|nr:hypothetical protein [Deltaproteobacteria bacterium]